MSLDAILPYALLLIAAFVLLAVIADPNGKSAASTHVIGLALERGCADFPDAQLRMAAQPGGKVLVQHLCVPLCDGETANLVATLRESGQLLLVEKKGVRTGGRECLYAAQATLSFLRQRTYDVRFESEVTGQWCAFKFVNIDGQERLMPLKY